MLSMASFRIPAIGELKLGSDSRCVPVIAAATACSFLPLSTSHLVSLVIGALIFLLSQALQPSVDRGRHASREGKLDGASKPARHKQPRAAKRPSVGQPLPQQQPQQQRLQHQQQRGPGATQPADRSPSGGLPPKAEVWKPSVMPVQAPTFHAQGWEAEVEELLAQLTPTVETSEAVAQIAQAVKGSVAQVLPGAEVTGFVGASLSSGKAFGVAVPEVDIVVSATPEAMANRLNTRRTGKPAGFESSGLKLRKSAVRACTDRLVGEGFKFRRSAFRGEEPKVVVISPQWLQSVPINLSVNAVTPACNALLMAECALTEPRAQGLVLLVKRWAKDRGLCHAARGHMSLYSWTLLSIYFLQVGAGQLLPPMEGLRAPSGLEVRAGQAQQAAEHVKASLGDLLKAFFRFYATQFDWRGEAVSVRNGRRAPPDARLPLHILFADGDQSPHVGPSIEDPFDATCNLGACTNLASIQRVHKEFERAEQLCSAGASLTELLRPWAPEVASEEVEE